MHTLTSQRKLTKMTEKSAVDTQSDDPFQFDDPPVTAPLILPQRNSGFDHRDDLPHHIRTQLQQSRIRNLAQGLEPDAKRLRLDAGKREVLMLSHDVSFSSECVLLTRRAASKEVQYDALTKPQQRRVNVATTRERDKWNEFGVTKFLSKKQLNDIMKRNPDKKIVGTRWVLTEKVIQAKQDYKARLVVQGCQEDKGLREDGCAHGMERRLLHDDLSSSSRRQDYNVFDAQSAYLDETRASVCCNLFDLRDERWWTSVVRAQQESA